MNDLEAASLEILVRFLLLEVEYIFQRLWSLPALEIISVDDNLLALSIEPSFGT